MKKKYINPSMHVVKFNISNVLCATSPGIEDGNATDTGGNVGGSDYGSGGVGLVKGQVDWDAEW